ncbi:hypothetical protein [Brevibacterium sp. XM4083]|uniref:hypothetical protein n=1 Tax=Brevibacterium sp. XM4083 TaxID=2583238 RepID=UPI0011283004|nr:hypothetical protein [Brevibacterium sp. XM4083]MCM1011921.1 hypothetical protein [Brevibacterium sp. XM4083]
MVTSTMWRMRDTDNRDDDGGPYEIVNYPTEIAEYVDGPVRSDLTFHADSAELNRLVTACTNSDLTTAQNLGPQFSIYIDLFTDEEPITTGDAP